MTQDKYTLKNKIANPLSLLCFHCLILWLSLRLCNTFPFIKYYRGVLLETRHFFFDLVLLILCLRHVHKFSFIIIILLRPLSAHALFENGRINKDGQKNKWEYIKKPERNACKDYPFHKYRLYLDPIRNSMLHSGGNL